MISAFDAQCEAGQDRPAYVFLRDDLTVAEQLSFRELAAESRALALRLAAVARPGDRVLLAFPPGLDFVRAFWACLQAGCVAVPVPAPDPVRLLRSMPRLRAILDDTRATLVWTSDLLLAAAHQSLEPAIFAAARWVATLPEAPAGAVLPPPAPADGLAYLQYTSGSTMSPRGVRVTHANALANVQALCTAAGVDAGARPLTWLPHFHDYGLIHGVVAPLCVGATSWLMSPLTFLRRPLRWLEAITALRITHSGAPASAYTACLRALDGAAPAFDLSSLQVLSCGAEPIRAETVARVLAVFGANRLEPSAFVPAYGLAETVLVVSMTADRKAPPRVLGVDADALQHDRVLLRPVEGDAPAPRALLVGCGRPLAGTEILIVDPATRTSATGDAIGEIWLRSASVGDGYWHQPEGSEATFGARLADGRGPFLRTGDLGFLQAGELFVTGRLKDLVIVHGGNHYPQDLEWTAEHAHSALRPGYGAAFSVDTADGEVLVLALETQRRTDAVDAEAIAAAVRRAVGEAHGLAVETVVLARSGALPRSSSGKIQRQRCRQLYRDGALATHAVLALSGGGTDLAGEADGTAAQALHVMPRDAAEQAVWDIWREVIDTTAFGVHESFFELGGTSLLMTQVASRIGQRMGVELPLAALFEHTTVATLADHVGLAIATAGGTGAAVPLGIPRVARGEPLPVSLSQRRMWVIQQFDPASAAYNVALSLRLRGPLDTALLQRAFDALVERHEGLRTRIVMGDDEPLQCIAPSLPFFIEHIDLSDEPERMERARSLFAERHVTPFDLATAPLHRATLLRLDARDHLLLWVMHHVIADNWSFAVLMREALALYAAWQAGREAVLAPIPIEYADYASWQRSPAATAQRQQQMAYWRTRLADLQPLDMPIDHPRPVRPSFRGAHVSAVMPPRLRNAVRSLCTRAAATPFVVLLAVFKMMLMRQSRSTDIAVGTPVANRHRFAAEHLVGTLVNTLVMRTDLAGDPSFETLVQRVRETAVQAYMHQEAPFDELVESLGHDRSMHPEGLVRVLFNVLNAPLGKLDHAGLEIEEFPFERNTAQFDLSVHIDTEFTHRIHLEYSTDVYAQATMERMLENYLGLIDRVLAQPALPLSAFPLVSPEQLAFLREGWNATQRALPPQQTLHAYLAAQPMVAEAVAVTDAKGRVLRHGDVRALSDAVAHELRARGIGRGHWVGLGVTRDVGMLVALLGVLKSGAGYLPMDPGFPSERLRFMVEDGDLSLLLTRGVPDGWMADAGVPVLKLDDAALSALSEKHAGAPLASDPLRDAGALDPAFMIFTSGSTGRPKGVAVPHRAMVNLLVSFARAPGLAADDRLLAVSSLSFDIAVLEMLLPLVAGAQILIADASQVHDPHALGALIATHAITAMQATPTLWRTLFDAGWQAPARFKALTGGEPLPPLLAAQFLRDGVELWNLYGPTETTVYSTGCRIFSLDAGISIGRPIDNTTVMVRDADGHPCPIGVPGELCIGGFGVALGYHRREVLTAERFLPDADGDAPDARYYRSGDLGRWRHDGLLEPLGRLDHQVKVRGLRIELGEIESVLLEHPSVSQGVVSTHAAREDDVRLVAYVVPHDAAPDTAVLRDYLRTRLPEYMLPQHIVVLAALPLLPNGKINRTALPAPQVEAPTGARAVRSEPTTPAERAIAAIWCELLHIDAVDLRDNFFDLGGHSLLAMRAVVAIRNATGWQIEPPRFVYETLGQIARPENLGGG